MTLQLVIENSRSFKMGQRLVVPVDAGKGRYYVTAKKNKIP